VVGGREFPISDQGGGAVMGLRLIQHGIVEKTPLASHVLRHFDNDVDAIVEWSKGAIPKDYGQFSPAIFEHAYQGDPLAISMLKQTAADIEMFLIMRLKAQLCLLASQSIICIKDL